MLHCWFIFVARKKNNLNISRETFSRRHDVDKVIDSQHMNPLPTFIASWIYEVAFIVRSLACDGNSSLGFMKGFFSVKENRLCKAVFNTTII